MALTKASKSVINLNLDDIADVSVQSPTIGEALVFNGNSWANAAVSGGGGTYTAGNLIDLTGDAISVKHAKINDAGGNNNVFVGLDAGLVYTTGTENALFGTFTGDGLIEGDYNVFLGNRAGCQVIQGTANILIGWQAGRAQAVAASGIMEGRFIVNNEAARPTVPPYIDGVMATTGEDQLGYMKINSLLQTTLGPNHTSIAPGNTREYDVINLENLPIDVSGYVHGAIQTPGMIYRYTPVRKMKTRNNKGWDYFGGPRADIEEAPLYYTPLVISVQYGSFVLATLTFNVGQLHAQTPWSIDDFVIDPADNLPIKLIVTGVDVFSPQRGLSFTLPFYGTTKSPTTNNI